MTHPLAPLARALSDRSVRYLLIGVSGANLYAPGGQAIFITRDFDLFLPRDAENLVRAWAACEDVGLELWSSDEPLDRPRDRWLANRIVERRALVRGTESDALAVDLSLVMAGFDFETVWKQRRTFVIDDDVELTTARLRHIVESKLIAGRPKDKLFLAVHKDALEQLLKRQD